MVNDSTERLRQCIPQALHQKGPLPGPRLQGRQHEYTKRHAFAGGELDDPEANTVEELAHWSGPQYFAYPHFAQAEADAWDTQPDAGTNHG